MSAPLSRLRERDRVRIANARVRARETMSSVVSRALTLTSLRSVFPLPQAGEGE